MIKVERLGKQFQDGAILSEISFEIKKQDFTAVMGPSGSGKSTLLYSMSGMDSISEGVVLFDGIKIHELQEQALSEFRLLKMGFVFQNAHLLKNLTIYDNIILPGLVAKKEPAEHIRQRAWDLMEQMGIAEIKNRDIKEVSGGQLQRASICRAMINCPEILFLDEPTGALNTEASDQVIHILKKLNKDGMTIVIVTHDARVAANARKVLYLKDGQIAAIRENDDKKNGVADLEDWLIKRGNQE